MGRIAHLLLAIAAVIIFTAFAAFAQEAPTLPPDQPPAAAPAEAPPAPPAPPPPPEKSPFEKAIEGCKAVEGLFTFYINEEEQKFLLAVKPDQLNVPYLLNLTLDYGDGYYFDSGAMMGNFPFEIRKIGKKLQVIQINLAYRAEPGSSMSRAIASGVSESIVGSSPQICEPDPKTGAMLIDPSPLFLLDPGVANMLNQIGAGYYFDHQETRFGTIQSFPKNTEVEVIASFKCGGPPPSTSPAIPDSRNFIHRYRYSLCTRPEPGYTSRYADDRIGLFTTMYMNYDTLATDNAYVRLVNRWRLEKQFPEMEVSPPKEPIVYWVANTVPVEYRDAVRDGILAWNKAFEKAGIKDAIVVKQQPDDADWSSADVRYNCVRWIVMPEQGYAVGPCWTDPYTGEIYAADVRICADFLRWYAYSYELVKGPSPSTPPAMPNPVKFPWMNQPQYRDDFSQGLAQRVAFGMNLLEARGDFTADSPEAKQFLQDAVKALVVHEVGHTMGCRHNFRASSIHSLYELQDKDFVEKNGLTGSVMDYNDANFAAPGMKQGPYWQTTLGPWDYWTIEYGYKPITAKSPEDELGELRRIAARANEPWLTYGTDEDAIGNSPRGIDPLTTMWDLGDDPLASCRGHIELSKEIMSNMEGKLEKPGTRYQRLRWVYANALGMYSSGASNAVRFVGGIYQNRDHIGDPDGRVPFKPVSAAKQREALAFLDKYIFDADAFPISADLLNKLAPERYDDYSGTNWNRERVDFPMHELVFGIQTSPLGYLYSAAMLRRLEDMPLHYAPGESQFTMSEMFQTLRHSIWEEVYAKQNVNSFRRNLQRQHTGMLIGLMIGGSGAPLDAASLARYDLTNLRTAIIEALRTKGLDDATRAHLTEENARITAAMDAQMAR